MGFVAVDACGRLEVLTFLEAMKLAMVINNSDNMPKLLNIGQSNKI